MTKTLTRILLIEDNPLDAELLEATLSEVPSFRFELARARDLNHALPLAQTGQFDVALLDLGLPETNGLPTFTAFQKHAAQFPILVLTGLDDETVALQAVHAGAQDFLVKGHLTGDGLVRAIRYAIERQHLQTLLREQSLRDELTGLYNRRGFFILAEQELRTMERQQISLSLFFADLDGLKEINDSYGHEAGDQMLVATAKILRETFRAADLLARFGGDEFVALAATSVEGGARLTGRLTDRSALYNAQAAHPYLLSFSMGVFHFSPDRNTSLDELIREADRAMYARKQRQRLTRKSHV